LFTLIKPFNYPYPNFVYSKDANLLDSPFPIIAGVSRQLFLRNCQEELIQEDRFVFDLDRGEVYLDDKSLSKIKFIQDGEICRTIQKNHLTMFNDAASHIFNCEDCIISSNSKGFEEEMPNEFLEPDHDDLVEYFSSFKKMLGTTLIQPLLDSKAAVSYLKSNFFRDRMSLWPLRRYWRKISGRGIS
jgi:hypothetical protein